MTDGYIKAAAATVKIQVADVEYNKTAVIEKAKELSGKGVKLAVFPELCVTGYTCQDLFFQNTLLGAAEQAMHDIAAALSDIDMITAVGLPLVYKSKLYNCAAVLYHGKVLGIVPKQHLPNYNEFYEKRHFAAWNTAEGIVSRNGVPFGSGLIFACDELPEFSFAVEICEDLWSPCPPSGALALSGATIILNLSAGNEMTGKADYRRELVRNQSARLIAGYVYASAGEGESTQDLVFAGHNMICENGVTIAESELFSGNSVISEIDVVSLNHERRKNTTFEQNTAENAVRFSMPLTETTLTRYISAAPFVPTESAEMNKRCELILTMQSEGLKKRLEHTHSKTAVIGVSGGLDSTLALIVCAKAMERLGRSNADILAVTMPCFGTTDRTKSNAYEICNALGATLKEVNITDSVKQHFADIGHDINDLSVVYENAQARERTQVLMDIANQHNGIVIGTGDLSELALGWATYNADHMSMYGVNCSVPKTLIRHLVKYYADGTDNQPLKSALYDVLDTPVSPELLPADHGEISQKTEDLVGPYELHDFFLYCAIRRGYPPKKVYRLALYSFNGKYEQQTVKKWLCVFCRRFFSQQFKRSCLPDGPKVGSVTLSPRGDWRMPSDAVSKLWLTEAENL
ncbi:MAG: NAD(+) synthase [Eubacterium sp.]|nr:NAD(+) synthase [Eubacterium sp.]